MRDQWVRQLTSAVAGLGLSDVGCAVRDIAYRFGLVRHRWYHLRRYDDCLVASELVTIMTTRQVAAPVSGCWVAHCEGWAAGGESRRGGADVPAAGQGRLASPRV